MRACPTESAAVATQQAPVLTQVPDGVLRLAQCFVQPREVEVTVRQIGILFKRCLVRRERRRRFPQILEQHALVEQQQRVGADLRQRPPIHFIGFVRPAALVEQASPVGPRRGVVRSEEHTSELQSRLHLVCRLLLEKKKQRQHTVCTKNKEAKITIKQY